jgi:PAS domain S-box-containing protein
MKIKTQFLISGVVFSIILLVIAVSVATTEQQVTQLRTQEAISNNIERGASNLNSVAIDYFLYQEDIQVSQWQSNLTSLSSDLSNLKLNTPQQQTFANKVSSDLQNLNSSFEDVLSFLQNTSRTVSVRIDPVFQQKWSNMADQGSSLASDASQLSTELNNQSRQANNTNTILIISLVGTFGAFLATIYLVIFRRTLKSVAELQNGINTVSSGNLDYVIETKRQDEVSELSYYFNQMTANRKLAEQKVLAGSFYSRSLIEASLDPLVTISSEGKITDVNKATEDVTGFSREELIGRDFSNYFTEPEEARAGYQKVFTEGLVKDYPLAIRHKSGKITDVLYNASVYKNPEGEIQGVFAAARDVTESKRVMRDFAETKNFLDNILQSSTKYSIIGKDLDHKILSWNEGAKRNYGYTAEEIIGKDSSILHTPEDVKSGAVDKLLKRAYEEGLAEGVFERIRKDGSRFIASVVVTRRQDSNGRPIGYLLISNDISEKKQAEEQLKQASQYSRSLIEASLDPLVTISADGKITDVNKSTEEVTGYSREELIGSDFSDYFTEPEKARTGYQKVFLEGYVRDYPLAIRNKSGAITDVLYNATVYRNESGQIQGIFAAARDITERKIAEELLRAASLYSRSLIEASLDPLVTISSEGKITDVNQATEEVTGYPREQLVGSDFSDYFTEPEKARLGYKKVFTDGFVKDYPLAIRNQSGKITDVFYNASIYRNAKGDVEGVFAAARDVTERKRAEEKVRIASLYSRSLIEASLDPLVTISSEGKITDVNESTEEVTGFSRNQLIGSDFSDYFTDPEKARAGYQEVFTQGFVRDYPLAIRHKKG